MQAVGIQQAVQTLPQLVQNTVENCEETIIVSEAGAVVLIEQQEWEHIVETLRLIQDKASLKALLDGHRQRDAGHVPDGVTLEEAFCDLYAEHSEKRQ